MSFAGGFTLPVITNTKASVKTFNKVSINVCPDTHESGILFFYVNSSKNVWNRFVVFTYCS